MYPGFILQVFVLSSDHGSADQGTPKGPSPYLFKEVIPVEFEVEDPGLAFVSNLNALDNVFLLLAIHADNITQLTADNPLNSVKIRCLKQSLVVGIDDDTMSIEPAQAFGCGAFL